MMATYNVHETTTGLPARRGRQLAWFWFALVLVVIVHGSLFPWRFMAPTSWPEALHQLLHPGNLGAGWGDLLGNLLLFVPYSAILGWLLLSRPWPQRWLGVMVSGVFLAFLLQVFQIAVPYRTPAMSDVIWNSAGLLAGMALVRGIPKLLVASDWVANTRHPQAWVVAALWLLIACWPLLPGLSWFWAVAATRQMSDFRVISWHAVAAQALTLMIVMHALRGVPSRAGAALALLAMAILGKLLFSFTLPTNLPANTLGWGLGLLLGFLSWGLLKEGAARWATLMVALLAMLLSGLHLTAGVAWSEPTAWRWAPMQPWFWPDPGRHHPVYTQGLVMWLFWLGALGAMAIRLGVKPQWFWPGVVVVLAALEASQGRWRGPWADAVVLVLPLLSAAALMLAQRLRWFNTGAPPI